LLKVHPDVGKSALVTAGEFTLVHVSDLFTFAWLSLCDKPVKIHPLHRYG
jgi:hypothetical protein